MADSLSTTVIAICGTLLGSGLTAWAAALAERRRNEALERQQIREEAARERERRRELRSEHLEVAQGPQAGGVPGVDGRRA
ncbi:hypothetical protein ACWEHT_20565 [Streptomyces sp. NPDC004646]